MRTSVLTAAALAIATVVAGIQLQLAAGSVMGGRADHAAANAREQTAPQDSEQTGAGVEAASIEAGSNKQPGTGASNWRYRRHAGYWWYWTADSEWYVWTDNQWIPYQQFVTRFQSRTAGTPYRSSCGGGRWYPDRYVGPGRGGGGYFGWERNYGYHSLSGYGWRWDHTEAARGR